MRRIPMIFALLVAVAVASTLRWTSSAQAAPCDLGGNYNVAWTSQANHRYVTAELGSDARLRARAYQRGPWEQWRLVCVDGNQEIYAFRSMANNRYVTAELGMTGDSYGLLRARATVIGAWEKFRLTYNTTTGETSVRSMANNRYVSAEVGWSGSRNGLLRARATSLGPWERFAIFV
jgi:hypothetical protein